MDGRPNRRNKAAFSSSSDVVLMGPSVAYIALGRMFCTVAREDNGSIKDELRNLCAKP